MESETPTNPRGNAAMAVRFRLWRASTLPSAAYRIEPRFWTPAGLQFAEGLNDRQRRSCKNFEPRVTGIAWTSRRLYLVIAAAAATYEHAAQLIHARALLRADPDYIEHHGKRVTMLLLANQVDPPIADFARRSRVRIVTQCEPLIRATDTKTDTKQSAAPAPESPEGTKAFSS
jgi:hypothetical protein